MSDVNQNNPNLPAEIPGLLPAPPEPAFSPRPCDDTQEVEVSEGWAVVLFGDKQHCADEVTLQIVLATGCCWEIAAEITRRASARGSAIVTIAARTQAERVAHVLRRIALMVAIEQV